MEIERDEARHLTQRAFVASAAREKRKQEKGAKRKTRRRMSGDFYPTHHRGPPRRWYASRRARTRPPRALALRREQARVRESWVLAGRRSGTHTQSANFLSVHWRGLACACRGAARCSHKRGKLTGTQMSEFTRSLSCYPAPLSSQLDTNKRGNVSLSHSPSV